MEELDENPKIMEGTGFDENPKTLQGLFWSTIEQEFISTMRSRLSTPTDQNFRASVKLCNLMIVLHNKRDKSSQAEKAIKMCAFFDKTVEHNL